jgi:hypothetical protein
MRPLQRLEWYTLIRHMLPPNGKLLLVVVLFLILNVLCVYAIISKIIFCTISVFRETQSKFSVGKKESKALQICIRNIDF